LSWPVSVEFPQDGQTLQFDSAEAMRKWARSEQGFWANLVSGSANDSSGPVRNNIRSLNRVDVIVTQAVGRRAASITADLTISFGCRTDISFLPLRPQQPRQCRGPV